MKTTVCLKYFANDCSSSIKKFLIFCYLSGNGNHKKILYISGNSNPENLLIFWKM